MPATQLREPCQRPPTKYHILSVRIGPPSCGESSHTFCSSFGVRRPLALISSSKLLPCIAPFAKAPNSDPRWVLPPSRGTMLIRMPAVSDSPSPPDVLTVVSCTLPTLSTYI